MNELILINKEYDYQQKLEIVSYIISKIIPLLLNELKLNFSPNIVIREINIDGVIGLFQYMKYEEYKNMKIDKFIINGHEETILINNNIHLISINTSFIEKLFSIFNEYDIKRMIILVLSHEIRHFWQFHNCLFGKQWNYKDETDDIDIKLYNESGIEKDANNFANYFIKKYEIEIINI